MKLPRIVLLVLAAALAAPAIAQETSNMEILREKIRADKKLLVAANMDLTEAEAKTFWPVYESYQKDLQQVNERLAKVIMAYADAYNKGPVPDDTAKKLLDEALTIEEEELRLKRAYVPKLDKILSGAKVARYMQMEQKIRAIVRYELAANIPLVK